ncbi:MAG: hypothetical protein M1834_007458 [Cirrosporium novae-zelandiae]|nr:MAG: hypothetical protein M1834_007458 [Cirrosporium novae-zelandiae]
MDAAHKKILLSDGHSVLSRQIINIVSNDLPEYEIHVLVSSRYAISTFTSRITKYHIIDSSTENPYAWLSDVLNVLRSDKFTVLFPVSEHMAILSAEANQIRELGVGICVPEFSSLRLIYDKIELVETLWHLDLDQPRTCVVNTEDELVEVAVEFIKYPKPAYHHKGFYVKLPIGSGGIDVTHFRDWAKGADVQHYLEKLATPFGMQSDALDENVGPVIVQQGIDGSLLVVDAVFRNGHLVAWHACSVVECIEYEVYYEPFILPIAYPQPITTEKRNNYCPGISMILEKLGERLKWHGPLSLKIVMTQPTLYEREASDRGFQEFKHEAYIIDVSACLKEPMNAQLAGTKLINLLLDLSLEGKGNSPRTPFRLPKYLTETHSGLISVISTSRMPINIGMVEFWKALKGLEKGEELTPYWDVTGRIDWWNVILVVWIAIAILAWPEWGNAFVKQSNRTRAREEKWWWIVERDQR